MERCQGCGKESPLIARALGLYADYLRNSSENGLRRIDQLRQQGRKAFGLPGKPPQDLKGVPCHLCVNQCRVLLGGRSYCGLRSNTGGRLEGATADRANVSWYHDPLPTTSRKDAHEALEVAKAAGLNNVRIGNLHLLS